MSKTAAEIVKSLGGPANIAGLSHCATRLRFQLRDASGIKQSDIEAVSGVMGAVPQAGNRYQVVIGGAVQTVYNEIMALPEMARTGAIDAAAVKAAARAKGPRGKFSWLDSFFEFLSDSFRPILGALLGASLFITFMALMSTLKVIPNWADPRTDLPPSWQFVNLCWQSVFVFLPLMVAYNASKKLNADPWVGFAIMAVVMLPGFSALKEVSQKTMAFGSEIDVVHIFGVPLTIFNYSSQVFPPLLMAAVLGPLYKFLKRVIPENVHLIFVPFLSMLIMIPLTAFLIGPIGVYTGAGLAHVLKSINDFSPFIFAILIPLAYPFMVPLGLHWPINAIMLLNIQTLGYDYIQGPMGAWNFACFGATAGVLFLAWRERDRQMRQTAIGALAAGLLGGISEPSLYGIHLRFKRIYPRMLVGCLVGGLIIGIGGGVKTSAFVFTSLLTIPAFNSMGLYAVAVLAAFFTAMILVVISGYRSPQDAEELEAAQVPVADLEGPLAGASAGTLIAAAATKAAGETGVVVEIDSPLAGTVVPLNEVPDPVFSKGTMGPGVAVLPSGNTAYAPGNGMVVAAPASGHAFGLVLDGGVELLIHIGIDTVQLKGEGFTVHVTKGQKVTAGTPLVTFDRGVIEAAGYPLVTPIIVLNAKKFGGVETTAQGEIAVGDTILAVAPAPVPAEAGL
ncbi:MAG TPA: glucose PTS transporter subunit IIA [Mycobacterium sp.]|uniref:glucose PTS transporter subunit IIA n=1 Tax=Mycolicibacterium sp. TaxID=2320850 RepID=UPI0025D9B889|nr:glucose PTS transporter subunit IIA [Mycolicibacterium sp.]HPX36769.1 glucose PTS transporter subunit IIA [Mycobacterium sp.]HQC76743.1 glucose PTS transporter subunit IIA [Mycobacterium sp.]